MNVGGVSQLRAPQHAPARGSNWDNPRVRRATIEDVAAAAGVSATTVSHVFSGKRPVKDATRFKVQRIAQRLGYRPNVIATSLRVNRTGTAMIVIPDITNPYYPALARGVQDVLRSGGYHALLCNTDAHPDEEMAFLDDARSGRVDGVIFVGFHVGLAELEPLAQSGVAVVYVGYGTTEAPVDTVRSDDQAASRQATAYLLRSAPGRVALINGNPGAPVARTRGAGFVEAYHELGLEVPDGYVTDTAFTRRGGAEGMRSLLDLEMRPSAVVCANDLIALGAIDAARDAGVNLPNELAIMGFDDIDAADIVTPRLTTVRNNVDEIGRECGRLLLDRMTGEYSGAPRQVVVPHEIILRESA